ncbi:MAG TPA: hypothetical protein VIN09_07685 [Chloroflexota bacterium]
MAERSLLTLVRRRAHAREKVPWVRCHHLPSRSVDVARRYQLG